MGYFTDMTEGPRVLDSKIARWSRRPRPSNFASLLEGLNTLRSEYNEWKSLHGFLYDRLRIMFHVVPGIASSGNRYA